MLYDNDTRQVHTAPYCASCGGAVCILDFLEADLTAVSTWRDNFGCVHVAAGMATYDIVDDALGGCPILSPGRDGWVAYDPLDPHRPIVPSWLAEAAQACAFSDMRGNGIHHIATTIRLIHLDLVGEVDGVELIEI